MGRCHVVTDKWDGTDPVRLGELGHVRELKFSHADPGGPLAAEFSLDIPPSTSPAALKPGRKLTIYAGTSVVWVGTTIAPERGVPWKIKADGLGAAAKNYRATGTNPYNLNTAVPNAVTRGLPWTVPSGLPIGDGDANTDQGPPALTVADVLKDVCPGVGFTWWLDLTGLLHVALPPLVPTVLFTSHSPGGGRVLSDYVTDYWVVYLDSSTAANAKVWVSNAAAKAVLPIIEEDLDLTSRGAMTAAQATAAGVARLALYGPRIPWAGTFSFAPGQVLNLGGTPTDPVFVRPPIMGRLIQTDPDHASDLTYSDFPNMRVGQTEYDDDLGTLNVVPYDVDRSVLAGAVKDLSQAFQNRR
jgi:hypothetical protein